MTPEQIRIAIAESVGWTKVISRIGGLFYGVQKGSVYYEEELPNWPEDLDAVHELEKTLTEGEARAYNRLLIVRGPKPLRDWTVDCYEWHTSALQRCEAYLRTKNLWKD